MKNFLRIAPFAAGFSALLALLLEHSGVFFNVFGDNIKMQLIAGQILLLLSGFKSRKLNPLILAIQSGCGLVGVGIWLIFLWEPFLRTSSDCFDLINQAISGKDLSVISSNAANFILLLIAIAIVLLISRVAAHSWAKMALVGNAPLRGVLKDSRGDSSGLGGMAMFAGVFAGGSAASAFLDDQFSVSDLSQDDDDSSRFQSRFSGSETDTSVFDHSDDFTDINPATGLPMIGGIGGIDVGGELYGMSSDDDFGSSSFDDSFTSSFDD